MSGEIKVLKVSPTTGVDVTMGDSGDKFTFASGSEVILTGVTKTGFPSGLFSGYAIFADQKTAGTAGGTATAGDWYQRTINTTIYNGDASNIALGTDTFTLQPGSYWIDLGSTLYQCQEARTRLVDTTTAGTPTISVSPCLHASSSSIWSPIKIRVTPSSAITYRVDYRCNSTQATYGLGDAQSWGEVEQYLTCTIFKEA